MMMERRLGRNVQPQYRYTIKQLMDLSRTTYGTFDLSKFSYDAARAGVIPQLKDYAMTTRKPSIHPPRGCSGESTSTCETDLVHDSHNYTAPLRTPTIPPAGLRAQGDLGFVRFLKKHSSPTHQRVTAGGRIVPMEPRQHPPTFWIGNKADKAESSYTENARPAHVSHAGATSQARRAILDTIEHQANETKSGQVDRRARHLSNGDSDTWFGLDFMPGTENFRKYLSQDEQNQVVAAGPIFDHIPTSRTTILNPSCPSPLIEGAYVPQYFGQDVISQQTIAAQKSLAYWSQFYEELDMQLKTLDRQRAMTALTMEMANQRKAIVQQRSDTKDIIRKISAFLGMSEQATSLYQQAQFNVNAPVYVPELETARTNTIGMPRKSDNRSKRESNDIQPPGARRPIPIVAPPDARTASKKTADGSARAQVDYEVTDQWEIPIGKAPLDLRQRQSKMAESVAINTLEHQQIRTPQKTKKTQLRSFSENDAFRHVYDDTSSETDSTVSRANKRAPPAVEADYVKQFDALRMPKGCTSTVFLHNGTTMEVEGKNLKRPRSIDMSEFERLYWKDIPDDDAIKLSTVPEHHDELAYHPYNAIPEAENVKFGKPSGMQRGVEPATSTNRWHTASGEDVNDHHPAVGSHQLTKLMASTSRTVEHASNPNTASVTASYQTNHLWADRERSGPYQTRSYMRNQETGRQENTVDSDSGGSLDGLDNKGYTSSSVQNIHAAAPFPFLDGTTEAGRGARALLGIAGKAKSPRVLQRAGRLGNTWFGPFRRGLGE